MTSFRLTIEADKTERGYWRDLWQYRELFWFLSWRDILVRYKQTVIGVLWAVIRPVLAAVVFSVIFGRFAKLPSDGMPYLVFVFSAMLPWQFFASSLSDSSASLIGNANMISKIYFPRIIMPVSTVVVNLMDFVITFVILLALMIYHGMPVTWRMLALIPMVGVAFGASIGAGFWLSALNVKYRDFRYIVPFVVQFGLYVSPVAFSSSIVPEQWRWLYSLNPMVGVIDGFRWAVSNGVAPFQWASFGLSLTMIALVLITGVLYFRKTERVFADVI